MKNKLLTIIIFFFVLSGHLVPGQDIHFSQFYNTPTLLNPALTGLFRYDYRVTTIYRSQWRQINAPFNTVAVSGDMNFTINPLTGDKLGVGIFVFNDQMGNQTIQNNTVIASLSYHKILDQQKRNRLSIGVQGGYVQKSLDYSKLYFNNQIEDYQVNTSLLSGEPTGISRTSYVNVNVGVAWLYKLNAKTDIHTGVSVFNVIAPKESFAPTGISFQDQNNLSLRPLWYGGLEYQWTEKISLHPELLYMYQSKAMNLNVGAAVGYTLKNVAGKRTMVMAGPWYRANDAVIFMVGLRHNHFNMAFSYDYTSSGLRKVRDTPQVTKKAPTSAFEITLTYMGLFKRAIPNNHTIPCGIF
jgi:type IX secretion system PorP/SprF family membrane protein